MIVRQRAQLPGRIDSVALSPDGDLGIVAVDGSRLRRFDLAGGQLGPLPAFAIPPDLHQPAWASQVDFDDARAAFLDDRTILLGRIMDRRTDSGEVGLRERVRTCLLAIDAETGAVKGDYDCPGGLLLPCDPLPLSPRHVLLGLPDNALCIDAESWQKVDQLRALDEDFDAVDEEGADTDERVAPNGLAFSPATGLLSVLWCYFNAAIVQSYRFDPARGTFARHHRGDTFKGEDAGYEARGLCTSPDGATVAAWLPGRLHHKSRPE